MTYRSIKNIIRTHNIMIGRRDKRRFKINNIIPIQVYYVCTRFRRTWFLGLYCIIYNNNIEQRITTPQWRLTLRRKHQYSRCTIS